MVVALCALLVALSGTSYAALKLPKNSVGAKQLKKKAVSSSKKVEPGAHVERLHGVQEVPAARVPQPPDLAAGSVEDSMNTTVARPAGENFVYEASLST